MARQIVILALVLFAVVGLASAAVADPPTSAATATVTASSPSDDNAIGTLDGDSEAAPVGGPVPAGVFESTTAPAPSPQSGAAALEVSAVAGVAVAAAAAVFF